MPVFLEMGLPGEHNRIKGSCKEHPHIDWFELSSMQWGLVRSRDPTEPSQVETHEINATMAQDESTSLLLKACLKGDRFETVVIDFAKEGANGMESYYAFALKDVIISQCTTSGGDHPVVSVHLNFTNVEWQPSPTAPMFGARPNPGGAAQNWALLRHAMDGEMGWDV